MCHRSGRVLCSGLVALFFGWIGLASAELRLTDANPLSMPAVGSYGLRVLSPTMLELTLINTKETDPGRVINWDWVGEGNQLRVPAASEFAVTAGSQPIAVEKTGFKRRPLYAPLKKRDLRIANSLYLQLAQPIGEGQHVEVKNPNGKHWPASMQFVSGTEPLRWSPVVHVNQVGYVPGFPKKAMAGYYLGSLGEMPIPAQNGFQLIDGTGKAVFQGSLAVRADQGYTYSPKPYQEVWEADFSAFSTPGEYRLLVPGLGTSFPFRIDEGVTASFARAFALGIYHQRCGTDMDLPHTRHAHDFCHVEPVQIPDMGFAAVNRTLANMSSDFAKHQTAPQLKDVNSSLYPFVSLAKRDTSGGHHDAGDYSKYTINSAGFVHFLVFAADAFPGAASLDNLGLPESGDGKSDLLQEAKWEADFLAKLQDIDGGFYFLVYPRDRQYEDDVLPDRGDPQIVFPKNTAVTAAAVAALAEAGSSPVFKQQFPEAAALYIQKAKHGWSFLQNAIAKHGKAGAYQKISHYGNEFRHDDELAWAAAALFVATGDQAYHQQLKAWYNPSDPNTRRWSWWRLYEGYGCAARTYAFAARSGRLPASALDPAYLAQCEAEIRAAADDHVKFARASAYGTSLPEPNKVYRTAGWYFSSERAFDVTVAYQLTPRPEYLEAVLSNLNYEGGCNPVNMTYITGIGSKRQREMVNQYAENDRRVLPPSGIPLGNVQSGFQYLHHYKKDLESVIFPPDSSAAAPYPFYDRWGDSFNTTTEFVIMDQARSLASLSFWMAQTSLKTQPWTCVAGQITGLPAQVPAGENVTTTLVVPGVDLSTAQVVWEARDQEPRFGNPVTFAAKATGVQWVEAEAQLPDGRRFFAVTSFLATTALNTPANPYAAAALSVTSDMLALFHADGDLADSAGRQSSLQLAGKARLDSSNLGWMTARQGMAMRFDGMGDKATVLIPSRQLRSGNETTAILVEAMVYVEQFVGYNRQHAAIVSLYDTWNAFMQFGEDMYAGPFFRGGTRMDVVGGAVTSALPAGEWHHLAMELNQAGYVVRVNGKVAASVSGNELPNWGRGANAKLELGNFAGWIDEVVVRSVHTGAAPNALPAVYLLSPSEGTTYIAPATLTLSASAADADGTIAKVEFFQGNTKIGEVSSGAYPYNFIWNGVLPGTYSVTAKATDDRGGSKTSSPVSVVVTEPTETVGTPILTPNSGSFLQPLTVTLATSTPGATIRYTTDDNEPTASSPVYTGSVLVSSTTTLRAKGFMSGMAESSVASGSFQLTTLGESGARVTFIKEDRATRGDWKGLYGVDGFNVIGQSAKMPGFVKLSAAGKADFSWSDSTADPRGLQQPAGNSRVAGVWYSSTTFHLDLNFTDGKTHRLALYAVDWDRGGRAQRIEVLDAATGTVLNSQTLASFEEGRYLVWDIKGEVRIRVTRLSGPNAVLSGLFFDPRLFESNDQSVAPLLSSHANQLQIDSAGFQLRISGEAAQPYILEASTNLVDWTPISTHTLSGSALDVVDLQARGSASRFYRTRTVPPIQPQYVIEVSGDLVHWTPIGLSSSPDLNGLADRDSDIYSSRFYRARPLL